jgi:PAS domain S-box-containing protein
MVGTMGFCHDLRIEEALKKEVASRDQYLLSILQASMDGLVTLDARGRIASWNRGATQLFGADAGAALGRSMDEYLPPRDSREIPSHGQTPGARLFEARIRRGDERPLDLLVTRTEIVDSTTGERGASLVIKDVTEQNRLQRELAQAENLAELGRLAASVAHEIKNPIAGLRGAIEILAVEHAREDPHFDIVQETLAQIRRLDSLVKDLLAFAKPISLKLDSVPLHLVLEATLPFVQPSAQEAGVALSLEIPAGMPPALLDPQQIQQVIVNLLMNGIQATPTGGTVAVSARTLTGELALAVTDTGGGIKPGDLKHIFEPFFTTKHIGTGLGLSIVQRIVSAHAGRIEVETREGGGTAFTVYLPTAAGRV